MEKTIHSKAYQVIRFWLISMRQEKNITQRELASILQVTPSWVGKVELGERRIDLVEYVRVCKALNIDPHIGLGIIIEQIDKED